ncbi:hypothetical protein [Nocardia sp. NPDC050710]|uniref:hypothetical protein n=1 Tax=Nocardia sp. NPDC050710 TaxID=3157220 RepID=UPI0033DEFA0E
MFSPVDMETIDIRCHNKRYGKALPHTITRHTHRIARPEIPAPEPPPSTGIDYLIPRRTSQRLRQECLRDKRSDAQRLARIAKTISLGFPTHRPT